MSSHPQNSPQSHRRPGYRPRRRVRFGWSFCLAGLLFFSLVELPAHWLLGHDGEAQHPVCCAHTGEPAPSPAPTETLTTSGDGVPHGEAHACPICALLLTHAGSRYVTQTGGHVLPDTGLAGIRPGAVQLPATAPRNLQAAPRAPPRSLG